MNAPSMWIDHVGYDEAEGRLKALYDRIKGPGNNIDNIMLAHSLRPHSMEGHLALYKNVLHHGSNRVPKWFLETLGVHVSRLNGCNYCVEHHFAGLRRLLKDDERADAILAALFYGVLDEVFSPREQAAVRYATKLTRSPASVAEKDVRRMRDAGFDNGEILEVNQVVAYFAYANRTVLGLGITTEGDLLGLSPGGSGDPDDWTHQ